MIKYVSSFPKKVERGTLISTSDHRFKLVILDFVHVGVALCNDKQKKSGSITLNLYLVKK